MKWSMNTLHPFQDPSTHTCIKAACLFEGGIGNPSTWTKPPTFFKKTDKLSHTGICPEWGLNLEDESL